MAKRYRDAITGEFMSKKKATEQGKDTTIAETVKKRSPRKPKPDPQVVEPTPIVTDEVVPSPTVVVDDAGEPEFIDGKRNPKFRMKMDVIFRGKIYYKEEAKKLPVESQEYLQKKGWEE